MEQNNISPINRFWLLLKPDSIEIRNVYIFAVLSGILSLALPLGIQAIINFIQMGQVSTSWVVLVFLVVLAIGFSGVLTIAQMRITENLQQRIFVKSAFEFADRIPKIKMEELIKRYAPELTNRFFDTLTIQKGLSKLLIDFTAASLQIIFGLILLSFYHSFFIFFGLTLVVLLAFILKITSKKGFESSLNESKYKYKIAHWLEEIAHARFSFKMAGNPELSLTKTDEHLNGYLTARNIHFKVLVQQFSFLVAFKVLIALALLIIGGFLVLNQSMNIGQFIAAEIIILLVLSSVEKLIMSLEVVYDVLTAVEKIGQVTDIELEKYDGIKIPESESGFEVLIDKVSFQTDLYRNPILKEIVMEVAPNQKVCVVSDSTVSTNTLFCLIGGMYPINVGNISIEGLPIGNLNIQDLRNEIGNLLLQDRLIHATVLENITLGRKYATFEEVQKIAKIINLTDAINNFSEGYNTVLNPEAHFIPQDITKKILLIRAFVGHPKLVLLEEPTITLNDSQIHELIELMNYQPNTTIIYSSKEDELMKIADKIIVFEKGKVVFEGTYQSFKAKK
ncbi:MAG: ABC transporter ATP-binding protein [Flavobacteriales bacterium]|nr:ABC transporter ATP-binding protein [Crocinitomicaceae bacterium]NBX80362.1 ABC transporter ATP-binding protein [Flavobacteriales bacterium]